ncbi:hypothetical protein [Oligoflexus tunisiensis]|uniref:hypothetical protein n=1 Tax=Oligoflexus tunisiensis TaxID=708132 RepID=UPI00114C8A3E|nr:hypothetical protein [Oligoflexus tunisiensis]
MSRHIPRILLVSSLLGACFHTGPQGRDHKSKKSLTSPKKTATSSRPSCGDLTINSKMRYFHFINIDSSRTDTQNVVVILNKAPNFFDVAVSSKETRLDESGCLVVDESWAKAHILDHQQSQGRNLELSAFKPGVIHPIRLETIPARMDPMHYVACGSLKDFDKFVPGMIIKLFDAEGKGIPASQVSAVLLRKGAAKQLPISEGGCVLLSGRNHGTILYSDQKTFVLEFIYRGPNSSGDPFLRMLGSPSKKSVDDFKAILRKQ